MAQHAGMRAVVTRCVAEHAADGRLSSSCWGGSRWALSCTCRYARACLRPACGGACGITTLGYVRGGFWLRVSAGFSARV